jgi:hypothetical protein
MLRETDTVEAELVGAAKILQMVVVLLHPYLGVPMPARKWEEQTMFARLGIVELVENPDLHA